MFAPASIMNGLEDGSESPDDGGGGRRLGMS